LATPDNFSGHQANQELAPAPRMLCDRFVQIWIYPGKHNE